MKAFISAKNQINVLELLEETLIRLPGDIKQYTNLVFTSKEIQDFIVEANIKLLEQGLRPDLTPIEKTPEGNQQSNFYERRTIYEKQKKGVQSLFVDLHDTGFFYQSLKVRSGSNELLEFSTDPKSEHLQKVWGDILGVSSEDLLTLINKIRPKIIIFVRDKLRVKK